MNRQSVVTSVAVAALLLGVSGCGGSDDKIDPKPTRTTAPPTPRTPEQPKGADGVTFDILNFEEYANDPVVLAWKKTNEAINASANRGKVLPDARRGAGKKVLHLFVPSVQQAWKRHWHLKSVAQARVVSSKTTGSKSSLVVCVWAPSTGYYDKNNKYVGASENYWIKQNAELQLKSGDWILTDVTFDGKCAGGAPA